MSNFGALNRLNNVEQSEFPQFLCGRILPVEKTLQGPISGKECVYYEAVVEKLEDKTDENGLIGIPDPNDRMKVWIPLYFEKKSADFVLLDPAFPTVSVYVPGSKNHVKVLATEDTSIKTANMLNQQKKAKVTVQNTQLPPQTEEFLKRGKVELSNDSGVVYRYRESSFEKGEQVAVLGVVEQITAENNEPINILRVVSQDHLTDAFFEKKGFNGWDKQSWLDLTETPCVILTDMPKYFQGLEIPPIANKTPHGKYINTESVRVAEMKR
eukprot:gene5805-6245_t